MALTSAQYDSIMRMYNERRLNNRYEQEQHIREVYNAIPELAALDEKITQLTLRRAEAVLGNEETAALPLSEYADTIDTIAARKNALLMKHGYDHSYLELHYDCPMCRDTGYIGGSKCACFKKAETELFYSQSNNKNLNINETFDNFRFDFYSSSLIDPATGKSSLATITEAYNTCLSFANDFSAANGRNLLFYGESGLGKTYLTNCIANVIVANGFSYIYLTATELFDIFTRSSYSHDSSSYDRIDDIMSCDLLIIDDLGTEMTNSFTTSKLFYCINDRILRNASTIISTNLALNNLYAQYTDRIFSRIIQSYKTLKFFGENIRMKSINS